MHWVHTMIFWTLPLFNERTRWRFGLNRRLLMLWAWLTLQPIKGFFPQISQIMDIVISPYFLEISKFEAKLPKPGSFAFLVTVRSWMMHSGWFSNRICTSIVKWIECKGIYPQDRKRKFNRLHAISAFDRCDPKVYETVFSGGACFSSSVSHRAIYSRAFWVRPTSG